jgi:hypothetical protein
MELNQPLLAGLHNWAKCILFSQALIPIGKDSRQLFIEVGCTDKFEKLSFYPLTTIINR